jgi:predicted DNA-binding transcriptional regulator AlpA
MPPIPFAHRDPYLMDSSFSAAADTAHVEQRAVPSAAPPDLMDVAAVCAFFGGTRPLDQSTLYRGIAAKRYPRPIYVGAKAVRWLRSECEATLTAMIAARDSAAA